MQALSRGGHRQSCQSCGHALPLQGVQRKQPPPDWRPDAADLVASIRGRAGLGPAPERKKPRREAPLLSPEPADKPAKRVTWSPDVEGGEPPKPAKNARAKKAKLLSKKAKRSASR